MPNPKVTYEFNDFAFGWSETYWLMQETNNPNDVIPSVINLGLKRKELLGNGARLDVARISCEPLNAPTRRQAWPETLVEFQGANQVSSLFSGKLTLTGGLPTEALQPFDILKVRFEDPASVNRKLVYLAGLPEFLWTNPWQGEVLDPNNVWLPAYNAWSGLLESGIWAWRHLAPTPTDPALLSFIGGVIPVVDPAANPPSTGIVTLAVDKVLAGMVPGAVIHLSGVRLVPNSPPLRGNYKITHVAGNVIGIQASGHEEQALRSASSGVAYLPTYLLLAFKTDIRTGWASRRRGRPFFSPHGRQGATGTANFRR